MQKSALIIIDLQAFIKKLAKDAVPYGWDKIIENNRALISAFDQKNQPVYIVTVEPKILWQSAKKAFSRMILQDELDKNPRLHQLVKYGPSAFKQSDYGLADELKNNSVSKIYVSGVSMSNGVLKTAIDGADLGFEAMIIEDACADRKLKNFQKTKTDEIPKFGKLIKTKEIIEELNKNV
ncbi:cysteine hydrolase family protein [Lactococcus lactis]|uniref:isochorismatase family cysteine hydrolase n=1 Tax=Lactococcus lactis TaxID=1358 RepID=UPI00117B762A|nr:cysteine hydrolase family protein [Lactococcus lactis]TRW77099.1 cysteine hydrolase family protein [Lactococcus lactis]